MNDKVIKIAMAALLHDIGKFWSRTGKPKPYDQKNREDFGEKYLHALWSGTFIEQHVNDGDIARWARNHHQPKDVEELIISLADHLASGERYTDEEMEMGQAQDAALVHILSRVCLNDEDRSELGSLPLVAHGHFLDNAFMPRDSVGNTRDCYGPLWEGFEKAANDARPSATDMATWLSLLRRFSSRIPSATPNRMAGPNIPDISLYEHSRVTAAIAACLAADDISQEKAREYRTNFDVQNRENQEVMKKQICQLVCGDLSGVQDFLYDLPRKGAAKTLRSRSFMLQLVGMACAEYCCREAGVPPCNILYSGGGRFYLLAPASTEASLLAGGLDEYVNNYFGGSLAVIMGATPITLGDFLPGKFSQAWRRAGEQCSARKARKFSERAKSDYDKVFGLMDDYVEVVSSGPGEDSEITDIPDENIFVRWGRTLTGARWLVKTEAGQHELKDKEDINRFFRMLGCEYHFVRRDGSLSGLPPVVEICELNGYHPYETLSELRPIGNPAITYRLIANHWPKNADGNNLTFEELAEKATGAKKLAVFRADVDNLGKVFTQGLGEYATAGRVAMLSQAMADFFEGYLNALCQEDGYADRLGVIYAGGDDLFLVGAWDAILNFAVETQQVFRRYAFDNPAFSLSGGIVLVEDHTPVRHFAEMAGEAEEIAKGHKRNGREKDSLTLLDMPFGSEELPRFIELKNLLLDVLDGGRSEKPLPTGFLRRLFEVWDAYLQEKQVRLGMGATLEDVQREMHWQRWRWMLVYGLREYVKKANDHKDTIEEIQRRILDTQQPVDDRLGMPLRWVELLLKKEERRERISNTVPQDDDTKTKTATERD